MCDDNVQSIIMGHDLMESNEISSLNVMKLKEGEYYVGAILGEYGTVEDTVDESNAYKFKIENNKITYIGDLHIVTRKPLSGGVIQRKTEASFFIKDNEKTVLKYLRKHYPNMSNKYDFKKILAKK